MKNSQEYKMKRVRKDNMCPVCGKPDWCLVASDLSAAICQRVEEGSVKRCGNAGWLHIFKDIPYVPQRTPDDSFDFEINQQRNADLEEKANEYECNITSGQMKELAERLEVSILSLEMLGIGWDGNAYTIPMYDQYGQICGIQRRYPNDFKCMLKGSRLGLFIPEGYDWQPCLLICEGASDTLSALDLGFNAIGRASCNSNVDIPSDVLKGRDVCIIGDNDEPGKAGAKKLALSLVSKGIFVKMVFPYPQYSDLRDWYNAGLTAEELQKIIDQTRPVNVRVVLEVV